MAQPPVQDQAGSAPSTTAGDPSRKTEFGYVDHVIDMREPDSRSAWVTHKTPIVVIQRHGNLTRYKIKADGNDPVDSNAAWHYLADGDTAYVHLHTDEPPRFNKQ